MSRLGETIEYKCVHCQGSFNPARRGRKGVYCSNKCRLKAWRAKRKTPPRPKENACYNCAKPVTAHYCSPRCRKASSRRRLKGGDEWSQARWDWLDWKRRGVKPDDPKQLADLERALVAWKDIYKQMPIPLEAYRTVGGDR